MMSITNNGILSLELTSIFLLDDYHFIGTSVVNTVLCRVDCPREYYILGVIKLITTGMFSF